MVIKRYIIDTKFGGPVPQEILCSSDYSTPANYNQYYRSNCCNEDPWLSYLHHSTESMMYGENGNVSVCCLWWWILLSEIMSCVVQATTVTPRMSKRAE